MAYVYILQSVKNGKFYVGITLDLEKRVKDHQMGKVLSTKGLRSLEMVFKQEYRDISMARKIENHLKRLKRSDYLKKIIAEGAIKMRP